MDLHEVGINENGEETGKRCNILRRKLTNEVPKSKSEPKKCVLWISKRTLELVKEKVVAMKKGQEHLVKFISKEISKSRRKDRRERILKTAKEVEARVQKGDSRRAY